MIVGSPMLLVQQLEVKYDFLYDLNHVCCQERWRSATHRQLYATFILVALFLLPLAAMLILYTRIGIELWIRKRVGDSSVLDTMNQGEVGKISRRKRRAIKMMITIVVLFTVCWAPFHTVHMLSEYNYLDEWFSDITVNMIMAIAQAIGFSNSFNNPIVYAFMNENFQKNCVSTFSQCCRRPHKRVAALDVNSRSKLHVRFTRPRDRQEDIVQATRTQNGGIEKGASQLNTASSYAEEKISFVTCEPHT